jgi:Olfactomedin-like domain
MIGKPVFQNSTNTNFGMWLKDPGRVGASGERIWVTKHFTGNTLRGYDGLERLRQDQPSVVYVLKELYFGTGNVVYNGAFYYHRAGHNEIIKYDLHRNETVAKIAIHQAAYQVR